MRGLLLFAVATLAFVGYVRVTRPVPYVGLALLEVTATGPHVHALPDGSFRSLACSDTGGRCALFTFVYWDEEHYRGPSYDPRYILHKGQS